MPRHRNRQSHSSHSLSVSARIVAEFDGGKEISPLKKTFSIAIRMTTVLAFLLGMPLIAIPQVSEQLQGLLLAKPRAQAALPHRAGRQPDRTAAEIALAEGGTTVTMLAAERSPPRPSQPNSSGLAATIEALKAQFVEAGVSYMVLERIGADSVQYRFRFDMPVAAGSAYRKRFQVVNDAPDEAMRQALKELQRWRVADREPDQLGRPTVMLR